MTRCRAVLLLLAVSAFLAALPLAASSSHDRPQETRILILYDGTREAHILWPYRLRLLVLEDVAGTGGMCWTTFTNGTTVLDPEKCRPLAGMRVKVTYRELMEYREAVTDENGIAEVEYRIFTFPRASFTVRIDSLENPVERRVEVESRPWAVISILSFSSMLSAMVYTLRRGWW